MTTTTMFANPYLDEVDRVERLSKERDPIMDGYVSIGIRRPLQLRYAWAIPTEATIRLIARLSPIVEIGAGTGYWASLLQSVGADVVAYDTAPPGHPRYDAKWGDHPVWHSGSEPFTEVLHGGAEAASDHPDRTLLLCWPPYLEAMGYDAVKAYHDAGGGRVAYIGESADGCCGSDAMFDAFGMAYESPQTEALFEWASTHEVRQWEGLHDRLMIFERKP